MDTVATLVKIGVVLNLSSLLLLLATILYKLRSVWKFSLLKRDSSKVFRTVKTKINEIMSLPTETVPVEEKQTKASPAKLTISPEDSVEIQKRLRKVEKLLTENDFETSERLLVEALGYDAEDEDVTTLLAFIYYKRNKLTKAENLYVSLIEKGTKEPGVYGNLAKVMEEQGKIDLAIAAAREAVKRDQYTGGRYAYLGKLYAKAANPEHAIDSYEEAMKYSSKKTEYMFELAKLYEQTLNYS